MTATASWTFQCDECRAHATVAGTNLKEAENTLVSVLRWESLGNWRHSCDAHNPQVTDTP
jgi:alkylhydroperoxidase family enzyme